MTLEFKPDMAEARARWARYWAGEAEKPLVSIVAPRSADINVRLPEPSQVATADNLEPLIDDVIAWHAAHVFLGDAIPYYRIQFAPDHFAALLGGEMDYTSDKSGIGWMSPVIDDWDTAEIRFQPEGYWWQRTVEVVERFRVRCDGKLLINGPGLQGGLDCLAALRGVEPLLMDLMECPEKVQRALAQVNTAVAEVRDALSELLDTPRHGSITRHGMYSNGRIDVPQCDFSCMLGQEMFREFGLPAVRFEAESLDAAVYHLDGPGAIHHLEAICEIEAIQAIQWQPGVAHEGDDWTTLRQRIDLLGKGQVLFTGEDEMKRLCGLLHSRQLFFRLGAPTEDAAHAQLARVNAFCQN